MKEICNFAFCFLPVTGEKGVCAISMWNLNMHFPLTFIIQSFKAKALWIMGIIYTTTLFYDTFY